jgi:hypothetical protein
MAIVSGRSSAQVSLLGLVHTSDLKCSRCDRPVEPTDFHRYHNVPGDPREITADCRCGTRLLRIEVNFKSK